MEQVILLLDDAPSLAEFSKRALALTGADVIEYRMSGKLPGSPIHLATDPAPDALKEVAMSTSIELPRGLRNHNPGNIDRTTPRAGWLGSLPLNELTDTRFEQFTDDLHGLRAIGKTLLTYQKMDGCLSIREMIYRWAPRIENDVMTYVTNVCNHLGVVPDDSYRLIDAVALVPLIQAIVIQENGHCPFPELLIEDAAKLALLPA